MKVALLSDCYPPRTGGIESQVGDLALRLRRAGHETEVFTATPGAKGEHAGAVDVVGGVPVHRMALPPVVGVPVNPWAVPEVARRLAQGGFDVAHVHVGVVSPFAWDMAGVATRAGLPTALTWHCLLDRTGLQAPWVRRWVRRGAVLSAVSTVAAKGVSRAAGDARVAVLPNGIDPLDWPVGPVSGASRPVRLVAVTRLAPRKRVLALLDVVARARGRLGDGAFSLEVLGGGPLEPLLRSRIRALRLEGTVLLRGRVDRSEVARMHREVDGFVSATRLEAFGIAALEARTAGLPVIARADSGTADVVTDGVSGMLAGDDDGLVDALVRFVADQTLRDRLSRHNAGTPPTQTWDRVIAQVLAEYGRAGA